MIDALSRAAAFTAALFLLAYGILFTSGHSDLLWLVMILAGASLLLYALVPRQVGPMPRVNRTIVICGAVFVVGFLLMTVQLVRIQIVESADILDRSAVVADGSVVLDPRKRIRDADIARGRILTRDNQVVADTVTREDGTFARQYPNAHLGFVSGYHSPLVFGSTQLESEFNDVLMGREGGNPFYEWLDRILHRTRYGYDLVLTIDGEIQQRAYELLGDNRGAVVIMDSETGAIYTMVGKPHIDPNQLYAGLGSTSEEDIQRAIDYWAEINQAEGSPLLFRPIQGLYAPGSVYKTITAAAAIEYGIAEPDTVYRNEGAITVGGTRVIIEQNLPDENRVSYTLSESYGYSLNVVFAQVGLQIGAQNLAEMSRNFGFEEQIPFDLQVTPSRIASDPAYLSDDIGLADTAFGQGQLFVTPLQMALMTQAVVNGGEMMEPYLVEEIRDLNGDRLRSRSSSSWKRAMSEDTAAVMEQMMIDSVLEGWASDAQIPGVIVGGKTGTAEVGEQTPHAWFVGFAGEVEPRYVIAVVVEHGGSGSAVALPIGRELLMMAINRLD
jgi:penicillin-binding protein A